VSEQVLVVRLTALQVSRLLWMARMELGQAKNEVRRLQGLTAHGEALRVAEAKVALLDETVAALEAPLHQEAR